MPVGNRFRHQPYPTRPILQPVIRRLTTEVVEDFDFSTLHNELSIRDVILVHGTFMGDDPFGLKEILHRIGDAAPVLRNGLRKLGDKLAENTKPFTSKVAKDLANYSPEYVEQFQQLVGDDPQVRLLEPTWSSQNHHAARCDLAVRLLVQLDELNLNVDEERVLLWGHSHAGNGFAILTNLLANHPESVDAFFDAGADDSPHWAKARQILGAAPSPHPLSKALCIATFGTPVRYGWDTSGCAALVHLHHHRVYDPDQPSRAAPMFPPHALSEIIAAKHGDWVQAFAIAGTDLPSAVSLNRHRALGAILESDLAPPEHGLDTKVLPGVIRDTCARWKTGTRCHTDGQNLLIDYEPCGRLTRLKQPVEQAVFGHAVATTRDWLPAHLSLVLDYLTQQLQPAGQNPD